MKGKVIDLEVLEQRRVLINRPLNNEISSTLASEEVEKAKRNWKRIVQQGKTLQEEELLDKYSVSIDSNNPKVSVIRKK